MSYLPKSIVLGAIKTRVRTDKNGKQHTDYEAYLGINPINKKALRITRSTIDKLQKDIKEFYQTHKASGDIGVMLTSEQSVDAWQAYNLLASAGKNTTLIEAVTRYIKSEEENEILSNITINEAWNAYYATMVEGINKRNIKYTVGRWVSNYGDKLLSSVTAKDVAEYLKRSFGGLSPKTYNQNLLYLKTFFNWCKKESVGYIARNPISSLEYLPIPWVEPEYMKVSDVEKLFRLLEANKATNPEWLAYAITNFFCGCRATEVRRMATDPDAAVVNISTETIRIAKAKGYQQGKRPRAFQIHPTALAWMKSFDYLSALKKITDDTQKKLYEFAIKNGVSMFPNCGRHTFITYHVAAYEDPGKTQAKVGTGARMMAENYRGLAPKKDGEAFFNILPSC